VVLGAGLANRVVDMGAGATPRVASDDQNCVNDRANDGASSKTAAMAAECIQHDRGDIGAAVATCADT